MNFVPVIGALSLGIVVGWLIRYFIRRLKTVTPKALGSVLSVALGGAAVQFLGADMRV